MLLRTDRPDARAGATPSAIPDSATSELSNASAMG